MAKVIKNDNNELEEKIDLENLKKELKDYVDLTVKSEVDDELNNINKKIINEKNRRLFYKNIIILFLLIVIGLLVYLLYDNDCFSKNKVVNTTVNQNEEKNNVEEKEEKTEAKDEAISLELLITKYSYLLDNVKINENCEYIKDYYGGNINNELKSYLAFNNVDLSKIAKEDDYNIFEEELLNESYRKLFDGEMEKVSFDYNKNKIRYISKLTSYISDFIIEKQESNIKREIIAINVLDNSVEIKTIEGIIKDEKLYNIISLNEISDYKGGSIIAFKEQLNEVTYIFNNEKLISIK